MLDDLRATSKTQYISPMGIALIHAALGDEDRAFAVLEEALAVRDTGLVDIKIHPASDPLRSDPRYEDLLQLLRLSAR